MTGWVWDVKRYTLHDGPGIRTTVFFKGCPLTCLWCANPEAQAAGPELLWVKEKCLGCDSCRDICPHWAIGHAEDGSPRFDRTVCDMCGLCALRCPSEAMRLIGRQMTVDEVLDEVRRDEPFHARSGGGLTLSGGEPLAQAEFAAELLRRYHREEAGAHTTIETCGQVPWDHFDPVVPDTDLFLYDIKHMDPVRHRALTGADNARILDNVTRLAALGASVVIRLPLIPGYNDAEDNIRRTADFARSLGVTRVDLLPYHRLGEPKYERLSREYALAGVASCAGDRVAAAQAVVEGYGLSVQIGG